MSSKACLKNAYYFWNLFNSIFKEVFRFTILLSLLNPYIHVMRIIETAKMIFNMPTNHIEQITMRIVNMP